MTSTKTRLTGQGRTIVFFGGPDGHIPLNFVQMINETPPELVAEYRPIQPIDWAHPAEIMTAMAMGAGTVELDFFETWSEQSWNRLHGGLNTLGGRARGSSANDTILDVVRAVENARGGIYLSKLIVTPQVSGEQTVDHHRRAVLYMNAKIVRVADGEANTTVESMEQPKRVTFAYTHRVYQMNRIGSSQQQTLSVPNFATQSVTQNRPI